MHILNAEKKLLNKKYGLDSLLKFVRINFICKDYFLN